MTQRTPRARMVELLGGDARLLEDLERAGIVPEDDLAPEEVESALVARTLVCELDVNMPGLEVILRLRSERIATRAQLAMLAGRLVHCLCRRVLRFSRGAQLYVLEVITPKLGGARDTAAGWRRGAKRGPSPPTWGGL